MRITNEADYAVRIVYCLLDGGRRNAKQIAEETGVTLRFALKILRKLSLGGIVAAQQGAAGGYYLNRAPRDISLREILELIDGVICINNCLEGSYICTRVKDRTDTCPFHRFFERLNESLRAELGRTTMDQFEIYQAAASAIPAAPAVHGDEE